MSPENDNRRPSGGGMGRAMMGGPPGGPPGGPGRHRGMLKSEKPENFGATMKKLSKYLGRHVISISVVCFLSIASTLFAVIGPKILGGATDELFAGVMASISGSGEGINFIAIGNILLIMLALYVVSSLFSYIQGFVMSGVTTKVTYKMRRDIDCKIHKLPLSYYDGVSHGDILSRITNDVDTVNQTLNQSLTQIITMIITLVGVIIVMFTISWQLTLTALLIVPLSLAFIAFIIKAAQKHFRNQQSYLGRVNGHIEEMLGSHVLVKAFNGQAEATEAFEGLNNSLYTSAWKANFLSGLMMPVIGFVGNLGYVAICVYGGAMAASGTLSVGSIQAFIQYVRQLNQPISQIAQISGVLQQTAAAAERVFAFLELPEESDSGFEVLPGLESAHDPLVSFEHVHFGYEKEAPVIKDFSAHVSRGQKVAIVGPTGAGKTTIVKLLMRFYDIESGKISIGGTDIRDVQRRDLRSVFGMTPQDAWLFNGTIFDNIRYGRPSASDEEVTRAAEAAQVDHFIRTLPDGYMTELNEETSNISQGQKQLITIARAILADPKILILDEATSSVDTRTEILIQKAMDNLAEGRTSFVIAHRLSTIRNADLILVMKDGDIVEQGSHDELISGGFYAELWNSQFSA